MAISGENMLRDMVGRIGSIVAWLVLEPTDDTLEVFDSFEIPGDPFNRVLRFIGYVTKWYSC